jgi:5-(carboxyamino)imidazole ribonucleotide synthase
MKPLAPGACIGILGGGQLGRMMSMAAARLGYHVHIFTPEADSPAEEVSALTTVASYEDEEALTRFAASVDCITLEFENIPVASLRMLARQVPVMPGADLLEVTQHRASEKSFVQAQGIATAPYRSVTSLVELEQALEALGTPAILKTSRLGYDGKGQFMIRTPDQAAEAWEAVGKTESVLEGFVDFVAEMSVIVARSVTGEMSVFPLTRNEHRHHILHESTVPAHVPEDVAEEARRIALQLAEAGKLTGLLAVELFHCKDNRLLVNELAPRPHNSGHWTMDACATSQFEQAIRAVTGLPLGPTHLLQAARMLNLIGDDVHAAHRMLQEEPGARLHLYGKADARPGRKMGHINYLLAANAS